MKQSNTNVLSVFNHRHRHSSWQWSAKAWNHRNVKSEINHCSLHYDFNYRERACEVRESAERSWRSPSHSPFLIWKSGRRLTSSIAGKRSGISIFKFLYWLPMRTFFAVLFIFILLYFYSLWLIHNATNKFRDSNHISVTISAIYVFRPAFESCDISLSGNISFAPIAW